MASDVLNSFNLALKNYVKNPIIIIPFFLILVFQAIFQIISFKINESILNQGAFIHYLFFGVFLFVSLSVLSFFLSGAISLSLASFNRKAKIKDFTDGIKLSHKNFIIILFTIIIFNIILFFSKATSFYLGKNFSIEVNTAGVIFLVFYILLIMFTLTFISFSNFILISEKISIYTSIKRSIRFVKSNYLSVLIMFIVFFILNELNFRLSNIMIKSLISLSEIINFLFIYPLLALVFAAFYILNKTRK